MDGGRHTRITLSMTVLRTVAVQILLCLLGQLVDVCVFVFGSHV